MTKQEKQEIKYYLQKEYNIELIDSDVQDLNSIFAKYYRRKVNELRLNGNTANTMNGQYVKGFTEALNYVISTMSE
jgi:hypothetical protein